MSLAPLLSASPAIQIHAFAAMAAFVLGVAQLAVGKGSAGHRVRGYVWVTLMIVVAASSFWIHEIRQWAGFSIIHLLPIWMLGVLPLAVLAARRHQNERHRRAMIWFFAGALVAAGAFTLLPGRIMHDVAFGG